MKNLYLQREEASTPAFLAFQAGYRPMKPSAFLRCGPFNALSARMLQHWSQLGLLVTRPLRHAHGAHSGSFHLLPSPQVSLFELPLRRPQPTQFCLAWRQVRPGRTISGSIRSKAGRRYLKAACAECGEPVLAKALMIGSPFTGSGPAGVDPSGTVFCAVVSGAQRTASRLHCLEELNRRGLALLQGWPGERSLGPEQTPQKPESDAGRPYRSLVLGSSKQGKPINGTAAAAIFEFTGAPG